jgi:hypothetical protein
MTVERHVVATQPAADLAPGGIERARGTPTKVPGIDTLITWIPGDVIAAYSAIVLALQPTADDSGSAAVLEVTGKEWLIGGAVFAAILTWLGAWSKTEDLSPAETRETIARMVAAAFAFAIWSFVVPGSWWYSLDWIEEHASVVPFIAGLGGLAFALLAEGIVRRVGK